MSSMLQQRTLITSNLYESGLLLMAKRGLPMQQMHAMICLLLNRETIPKKYRDHKLNDSKKWKDCRELHVQPDWLLIYRLSNDAVTLIATGTHADLY